MVALVTHETCGTIQDLARVPDPWCKLLLLPDTVCGINIS